MSDREFETDTKVQVWVDGAHFVLAGAQISALYERFDSSMPSDERVSVVESILEEVEP